LNSKHFSNNNAIAFKVAIAWHSNNDDNKENFTMNELNKQAIVDEIKRIKSQIKSLNRELERLEYQLSYLEDDELPDFEWVDDFLVWRDQKSA
jgi:predicted nuclease with TOPRIM domain